MTLKDDLAEELRRDIEAGKYPPGSLVPGDRKLADTHHVSRITARGALQKLVSWGLVTPRHGIGFEVRSSDRLRWIASDHERGGDGPAPNDSWSRQVRMQGRTPSEDIVAVQQIKATAEQAAQLDVEPGAVLVARRRLRSVDGEPHMIAVSYYPYDVVKGTTIVEPGDVQPGTFKVFELLGRPWTSNRIDHTIARMPTPAESDALDLPDGVAVLQLTRVSRDRAGIPVRLAVFVIRGDRGEIEHDYEEQ